MAGARACAYRCIRFMLLRKMEWRFSVSFPHSRKSVTTSPNGSEWLEDDGAHGLTFERSIRRSATEVETSVLAQHMAMGLERGFEVAQIIVENVALRQRRVLMRATPRGFGSAIATRITCLALLWDWLLTSAFTSPSTCCYLCVVCSG